MEGIDSLDIKLIQLLGQDARQPSERLAKQLNVSPATVRRRVRKLLKSRVLRIIGEVDPAKVGYRVTAVIAFDVAHEKLDSVTEMLDNSQEIRWLSTTTGRFDIIALAQFSSTDELSNFVQKELSHVKGVRDSETFVCLQVKKGRYTALSVDFNTGH